MSKVPFYLLAAFAALWGSAPAHAAGDAAKGETDFKKCRACHSIIKADGTAVVAGGKVGPNLYGVIGRAAGILDFAYSDLMKAAGAKGLIWDEAALATYVIDPTAYLREKSGATSGNSKMSLKLAKGGEDIAAYLAFVAQN